MRTTPAARARAVNRAADLPGPDIEEREALHASGWIVLPLLLGVGLLVAWTLFKELSSWRASPGLLLAGVLATVALSVAVRGFVVLEPGQALVTTFFGDYDGTVRTEGFHYLNPLSSRERVSVRIENLQTPTLKVNDLAGNPIEVAATLTWEIADTARASFAVSDHAAYIRTQAESALRQVVARHPYDGEQRESSLRGNIAAVASELVEEIGRLVAPAGLRVLDARLSHLAYASEIASAMLRSQQAEQVIAARSKIVTGAVQVVKNAIEQLEREGVVSLAPAERARLVSNLLTVLVSENAAQSTINVGSA